MLLGQEFDWLSVGGPRMLGINLANQSRAAGAGLPPVTAAAGDGRVIPWSPDSPVFWLLAIAGLTLAGIAGASFRVRVGPGRAGVDVGRTGKE